MKDKSIRWSRGLLAILALFCFLFPLYSQEYKGERKIQGKELDNLLNRLERNLGKTRSLKSRFLQNKYLAIFNKPVQSQGVFLFLAPDRVRFEITSPFHSVMIASSTSVAKYEWIGDKCKKIDMGSPGFLLLVTGQIATWTKGLFREKKNLYHIEGRKGKGKTIILIPKNKNFRKHIQSIEVGIAKDEKSLEFVIIREKGGDYTQIVFSDKKYNMALSEEIFATNRNTPVKVK